MSIMEGIKLKFLNRSGSYNYYKSKSLKLEKDKKKVENNNSELKKDISQLKNLNDTLKKDNKFYDNLIRFLIYNKEFDDEVPNYCPFCGDINKFDSFGIVPRERVRCKKCKSLERHRFFYLVFTRLYDDLFNKNVKLLHFAPEVIFYEFFSKKDNIDYYPVDINLEKYDNLNISLKKQVNMENIPYEDETFDIIYTSHVLEHVPDDNKALNELYRVLKSNGTCFIAVPIHDISETLEKEEYNTPELRLKYYGQSDHVRKYGKDFINKLYSANFKVEEIVPKDIIENDSLRRVLNLNDGEQLFICNKK